MDKKEPSQYLIVSLADKQYAINLIHAVEIIDPRKAHIAGAAINHLPKSFEYESNQIPVVDLWRYLQNEEREVSDERIMVVTECTGGRAAFLVDSADEILRIDSNSSEGAIESSESAADELIEARLTLDDRNIPVVNLPGIYKLSGVIK